MDSADSISDLIEERKSAFIALSDELWGDPELRWAEHRAVEAQINLAETAGMRITRNVAGLATAFQAEAGSGGPVIAMLGEFDALAGLSQESGVACEQPDPQNRTGRGHGCGHHLFGSASLLAAISVAKHLELTGTPGRVRYYGCPAEEAAAGKTFMVKEGAFDDVDAAVTWHPASTTGVLQARTLAVSQSYFYFTGVASHAGNSPHLGRSALDAAELMNVGVNFLREHMPLDCRVHYSFNDAGGESPNVVQGAASLFYLVRAPTVAQMQELYARVVRIGEGAALMTDTHLRVEFDGGSAELLPNGVLEKVMERSLDRLGTVPFDEQDRAVAEAFSDTIDPSELKAVRKAAGIGLDDSSPLHVGFTPLSGDSRPMMGGSTDVGDVSWTVPTVQCIVACAAIGTPAHSWQFVAQGKLPAAHKGMVHAAKVMALTAVDLLTDGSTLDAAKVEFTSLIDEYPYVSPIPDGIVAPPLRVVRA